MELVRPAHRNFEPSPVSPKSSQRAWYSPRRNKHKASASNSIRSAGMANSPGAPSVTSFDPKIVEADKVAGQQEMERLYAAVMGQDPAQKSASITSEVELSTIEATRRPLRLITEAPGLQHLQVSPEQSSPLSPRSLRSPVRDIYPPDATLPQTPKSPTSPIRAGYPAIASETRRPPVQSDHHDGQTQTIVSDRHVASTSPEPHASASGKPKRLRRSLQRIITGASWQRYAGEESDSGRTPLTPGYYFTNVESRSSPPPNSDAPTTPATHGEYPNDDEHNEIQSPHASTLLQQPPHDRSSSVYSVHGPMVSVHGMNRLSLPASPRVNKSTPISAAFPAPIANPASNISSGTIGSLPFREMHPMTPFRSPGLQTTYLERRRDVHAGPRTGLATPYSPYMPFTPVTPVTPHLTSRAERRQRERGEGRRVLGREDAVIDEDEMWGTVH